MNIYAIARHIITPLSDSIDGNIQAIMNQRSAIALHSDIRGQKLVESVQASLFDEISILDSYTQFESLCITAVTQALESTKLDVTSDRCLFVLSSTKGDLFTSMADTATHIALHFGNRVPPVVVSTACTSGVSAQLTAFRALRSGQYDTTVIIGCDLQSEFIISGFQSFHAVSSQPCQPFDAHRDGLNPGEAVAVLVLSNQRPDSADVWTLLGGSIHNDANHISGPSRTGEGSLRCLNDMLALVPRNQLACVSVHGTATVYNDEMESIALNRAGISDIPVSALKGFYGHTMGAAGLLETILSMRSVEQGLILPSRGFHCQGTSFPVNVSLDSRPTVGRHFIKLLSGFGGVNAAVAWTLDTFPSSRLLESKWKVLAETSLTPEDVLDDIYRNEIGDYPKYFKMDRLSRLAFVAVERLIQKSLMENPQLKVDSEHCYILLANQNASVHDDTAYQATISDKNNYFPSPALFVYTLPNIMTGELAIRHHLMGETSCYILSDPSQLNPLVDAALHDTKATQAIVGWIDYPVNGSYYANVQFLIKE